MTPSAILRLLPVLTALIICGCPADQPEGEGSGAGSITSDSYPVSDEDLKAAHELLAGYSDEERAILAEYDIEAVAVAEFIEERGLDDAKVTLDTMLEGIATLTDDSDVHPAEVVVGDALAWRELGYLHPSAGPFLLSGLVFAGNFDPDLEDEVLYIRDTGWELFNLDGTRDKVEPVDFGGYSVMDHWDFDGDGIDELLAMGSLSDDAAIQAGEKQYVGVTEQDVMFAYAMDGTRLGHVNGHPMGPQIVHGDFDGDGLDDLYMSGEGPYGGLELPATAFGLGGKMLFERPAEWNSPYLLAGDIDGDGRDEVINSLALRQVEYTGLAVDEGTLSGVIDVQDNFFSVTWCGDVTGDGHGELVSTGGQVLNADGDQLFEFEVPEGWAKLDIEGTFTGNIHPLDVEGERKVLIHSSMFGGMPGAVGLWNSAGSLEYLEYIGEKINEGFVLNSPQGRHIVLVTESRVIAWP